MIVAALVERLLFEGESVSLDFKGEQYSFVNAEPDEKAKLLKDVLAFANAWRRVDAYILIGVREPRGGRAEIVGIAEHIDDAQLQQFVNSKTQQPVHFGYAELAFEGRDIAVIHIPLQERPVFLKRDFGGLLANTVYVRRGSSTAVATPDEIARMGVAEDESRVVALDVAFADSHLRERVSPTLTSLVLDVPNRKTIDDYESDRRFANMASLTQNNADYYRQLVSFTRIHRLVAPVQFVISNDGTGTAHDVRLEVWIPGADAGITVLDIDDYPTVPQQTYDTIPIKTRFTKAREPDLVVSRVGARWLISGRVTKVQAQSAAWLADPVFVGSTVSTLLECSVRVFADNLSSPHEQVLSLPIVATREQSVTLDRILELEGDRFANSLEHRRFLSEHGFDSEDD